MNVQELTDRLAEAHQISKADARAMIGTIVDAIAAAAKAGDEVTLPGFGKFKVRERKAREARNPQTGAMVKVPAQKKLAFLPAKALKDSMNGVKAKAVGKSTAKASAKAAAKPAAKAAAKPAAKPASKPAGKSGKK